VAADHVAVVVMDVLARFVCVNRAHLAAQKLGEADNGVSGAWHGARCYNAPMRNAIFRWLSHGRLHVRRYVFVAATLAAAVTAMWYFGRPHAGPADWQSYMSEQGGWRAEFPGKPSPGSRVEGGLPVAWVGYEGARVFARVEFQDNPHAPKLHQPGMMDRYFANVAKSEAKRTDKLLSEGKRVMLGAHQGIETASVREGVYRRQRVFVVGSWSTSSSRVDERNKSCMRPMPTASSTLSS